MRAVFLFTRDLRATDNLALNYALKNYDKVALIFCFDPAQIKPQPYRSIRAIQFMVNSVKELNRHLDKRLNIFYGATKDVVASIRKQWTFDHVVISKDYTPFSKKRAKSFGNTVEVDNHMLVPGVRNKSGSVYKVFTPFYREATKQKVPKPVALCSGWKTKTVVLKTKDMWDMILPDETEVPCILHGGRREGLRLLNELPSSYSRTRDNPNETTSLLSAHHKFGTISVRETYWRASTALRNPHKEAFLRQLYWRDFYYHISEAYPRIYRGPFKEKYAGIRWTNSKRKFKQWCEGRTGVPIVDAGMRQMNETGWMHNRLRMIVSSFLCKDLHVDWRWGERYFATQLVDYDPAQNNGGWQWSAGTGTDAQPYFRIMNPWSQGKRFDPRGLYIRKYVSEIGADVNPHDPRVHDAIVDHSVARKETLVMYKV